MRRSLIIATTASLVFLISILATAQMFPHKILVHVDRSSAPGDFVLARTGHATAIYFDSAEAGSLETPIQAFASDIERVTGTRPQILNTLKAPLPHTLILVGIVGRSPEIERLRNAHQLDTSAIEHKWESAVTTVVQQPMPGVKQALVIAGSDRRGAAFALFTLSRQMGVSPWTWWADVPVPHHPNISICAHNEIQSEPSVQYRGIFLNDEDWGLRPWAARKMDPQRNNIGPNTYACIFELLLRLHANSLWPAMHPGTLPFNAVPENAKLADRWGIVMGSSHSEALLRNNVGEWNEKTDGPWNYQINSTAIDAYWDKRVQENGRYENFYTVGMRGVHDTGLEATGSLEVKAHLVGQAMADQRAILARYVTPDVAKIPQVIWLYKESLSLYRAGMTVPPDVTLGWTDDNYGYIRQLPTIAEQQRPGGNGLYYHVSYWGFPHDYLWLCSTPPSLIQEEMTKAWDHGVRRYWILNVGDIKPAESDIDFFLQLAWNEPAMAHLDQRAFLERWTAEQFPPTEASAIADVMNRYYQLNFVRKPEFMGFNGYNDGIKRTDFNPLAWPEERSLGQNGTRLDAWNRLASDTSAIAQKLPSSYQSAYFELVRYPVVAAAAQNSKFLYTDRSFLDAAKKNDAARLSDSYASRAAYDRIQMLTAEYNQLEAGKWDGMMSASPREREVFKMPALAAADENTPLPPAWDTDHSAVPPTTPASTGYIEEHGTVSINASHFARSSNGAESHWRLLPELGISGPCVVFGEPGLLANRSALDSHTIELPWLEYDFSTTTVGPATLALHLLPTFPVDSDHRLRFTVSLDGQPAIPFDLAGSGEWQESNAPAWESNVRRNSAILTTPLPTLRPGHHTLRLIYEDPGVVFEHIVITFPGAPPAYPVPPETLLPQ